MAKADAGGASGNDSDGQPALAAPPAPDKPRRPRRKAAVKALPANPAAGTAGPGMTAELGELRRSMDRLTQGLDQMLAVLATHQEMLTAVLAAATATTDPEHRVARALEDIAVRLNEQHRTLHEIGKAMTSMPRELGATVSERLAAALAAVR